MNTPDFSLFSKTNFNRGAECHSFVSEELEAEEDELRRNEEIKDMMQNAFDDLDDDCHSINSSSYLASLSGCCNTKTSYSEPSPWSQKQTLDEKQEKFQHMQTDINSKSHSDHEREYFSTIQKLQTELDEIQKQFKEEKSKWMEKFFNEEEERKLAVRKHEEINELYYESQMMLLQRETELKNCEEKLQVSEKNENESLEEIKLCKLTIKEIEQRLASQERKNFSCEEQVDNLRKKISIKEEQKFNEYQKEIQNLNEKLTQKEKKCFDLEQQLQELQQLHKSVVAEKSDTIAKLIVNLETCQSQCHKLMSNSNGKLSDNDSVHSVSKFKAEARQSLPANVGGSPKLIEELCRAYSHIKEKSSEIKFLQEQLKSCIRQIKFSKEAETKYVADLATLKDKLINLEEKNNQLENENRQLKNEVLTNRRESSVDQSGDENLERYLRKENNEIAVLSKKLGTSFEQCDTLKKMYLDVSTAKEKLLFQNQQLQADIDKLKSENTNFNEIVQNLNKDIPHVTLHGESLGQDSVYLKYCPRNDHDSEFENVRNEEVESLKNELKICGKKLKENSIEHAKQLEVLRIGVQEYVTGTETQHQKQISQLEEEYSKKIMDLESKHREQFYQFETEFKEQVLKVSTEEIKNLSNIFQRHFDDVSETVGRLQNELENKNRLVEIFSNQLNDANRQLQQRESAIRDMQSKYDHSSKESKEQLNLMNEKHEKLLSEIDKIYTKYKAARKAAVDLKQTLNTRSQLLIQHHQYYAQTLNEIQKYLNETLDCKSKNDANVTKFDITKEDLIVPDDEINAAIVAIKKQLENLKHR